MRKEVILVTGAAGEMGQALVARLADEGRGAILALDVNPLPEATRQRCQVALTGDILDEKLLSRLVTEFAIPLVYHLAAVLSTRAEYSPEAAHRINVEGTLALLRLATEQGGWMGRPVTFMFPSSIAAYGLPDLPTKARAGAVKEHEWNVPTTMYGCNKLYGEHLGRYYARHYRQLAMATGEPHVDFRSLRFPGLISAFTLPTGGTSDYAPEMLHRDDDAPCFSHARRRAARSRPPVAPRAGAARTPRRRRSRAASDGNTRLSVSARRGPCAAARGAAHAACGR